MTHIPKRLRFLKEQFFEKGRNLQYLLATFHACLAKATPGSTDVLTDRAWGRRAAVAITLA